MENHIYFKIPSNCISPFISVIKPQMKSLAKVDALLQSNLCIARYCMVMTTKSQCKYSFKLLVGTSIKKKITVFFTQFMIYKYLRVPVFMCCK